MINSQINIQPITKCIIQCVVCSCCETFQDASKLLDALRVFDSQVYGVAHGLLMGHRQGIWDQTQTLFDELEHLDSSTASAFYNALTDMLWHFGQVELSD